MLLREPDIVTLQKRMGAAPTFAYAGSSAQASNSSKLSPGSSTQDWSALVSGRQRQRPVTGLVHLWRAVGRHRRLVGRHEPKSLVPGIVELDQGQAVRRLNGSVPEAGPEAAETNGRWAIHNENRAVKHCRALRLKSSGFAGNSLPVV